jgi:hypothetical protein
MMLAGLALIVYANKSGIKGPLPENISANKTAAKKTTKKKSTK